MSVAEIVREVVSSDPTLRLCVEMGVVNYSKLAKVLRHAVSRVVGKDVSAESVKMALIRYYKRRASGGLAPRRGEVIRILARSTLELRSDIAIVSIRASHLPAVLPTLFQAMQRARFVTMMLSGLVVTVIMDSEAAGELVKGVNRAALVDVQNSHAAIILVSPIEIMRVPGVLAYISSVLAQNDVNIVHVASHYTDTVIIVSKEDMARAFNVLVNHIEMARKILERAATL